MKELNYMSYQERIHAYPSKAYADWWLYDKTEFAPDSVLVTHYEVVAGKVVVSLEGKRGRYELDYSKHDIEALVYVKLRKPGWQFINITGLNETYTYSKAVEVYKVVSELQLNQRDGKFEGSLNARNEYGEYLTCVMRNEFN